MFYFHPIPVTPTPGYAHTRAMAACTPNGLPVVMYSRGATCDKDHRVIRTDVGTHTTRGGWDSTVQVAPICAVQS